MESARKSLKSTHKEKQDLIESAGKLMNSYFAALAKFTVSDSWIPAILLEPFWRTSESLRINFRPVYDSLYIKISFSWKQVDICIWKYAQNIRHFNYMNAVVEHYYTSLHV